jgi:hypothetical protein
MSEGYFVDAKKVALGGYLHLLQAPFRAAVAIEHCLNVPFLVWHRGGCGAGTILVNAFTVAARRTMCYWCDALITHCALTSYLVLIKIRYSSFNNIAV